MGLSAVTVALLPLLLLLCLLCESHLDVGSGNRADLAVVGKGAHRAEN